MRKTFATESDLKGLSFCNDGQRVAVMSMYLLNQCRYNMQDVAEAVFGDYNDQAGQRVSMIMRCYGFTGNNAGRYCGVATEQDIRDFVRKYHPERQGCGLEEDAFETFLRPRLEARRREENKRKEDQRKAQREREAQARMEAEEQQRRQAEIQRQEAYERQRQEAYKRQMEARMMEQKVLKDQAMRLREQACKCLSGKNIPMETVIEGVRLYRQALKINWKESVDDIAYRRIAETVEYISACRYLEEQYLNRGEYDKAVEYAMPEVYDKECAVAYMEEVKRFLHTQFADPFPMEGYADLDWPQYSNTVLNLDKLWETYVFTHGHNERTGFLNLKKQWVYDGELDDRHIDAYCRILWHRQRKQYLDQKNGAGNRNLLSEQETARQAGIEAYKNKQYDKAEKYLRPLAEKGDLLACEYMTVVYARHIKNPEMLDRCMAYLESSDRNSCQAMAEGYFAKERYEEALDCARRNGQESYIERLRRRMRDQAERYVGMRTDLALEIAQVLGDSSLVNEVAWILSRDAVGEEELRYLRLAAENQGANSKVAAERIAAIEAQKERIFSPQREAEYLQNIANGRTEDMERLALEYAKHQGDMRKAAEVYLDAYRKGIPIQEEGIRKTIMNRFLWKHVGSMDSFDSETAHMLEDVYEMIIPPDTAPGREYLTEVSIGRYFARADLEHHRHLVEKSRVLFECYQGTRMYGKDEVIDAWEADLKLRMDAPRPVETDQKAMLKAGIKAFQNKRYDEAEKYLKPLAEEGNLLACEYMTVVYARCIKNPEMLERCMAYLENSERNSCRALAEGYLAKGRYAEALDCARRNGKESYIDDLLRRMRDRAVRNLNSDQVGRLERALELALLVEDPSLVCDAAWNLSILAEEDKKLGYLRLAAENQGDYSERAARLLSELKIEGDDVFSAEERATMGAPRLASDEPAQPAPKSAAQKVNRIRVRGVERSVSSAAEAVRYTFELLMQECSTAEIETCLSAVSQLTRDSTRENSVFRSKALLELPGQAIWIGLSTGFPVKCDMSSKLCRALGCSADDVVWYDGQNEVYRF